MNDSTNSPDNSKPSALFDKLLDRIVTDPNYSLLYSHSRDLSFGETDPAVQIRKLQVENKRLKVEIEELKALLRGKKKSKRRDCNVYIIANDANEYKIGISEKPERRLAEIAKALKVDTSTMNIIYQQATSRNSAFRVEGQLHKEFSYCRLRGEWFALSQGDLEKAIIRCAELIEKM